MSTTQPEQKQGGFKKTLLMLLGALLFPIFMAAAYPASYISAMHAPAPADMRMEVIGTSTEAQKIATGIGIQSDHTITVTSVPNAAIAQQHLRELDSRAAYDPATGELWVASSGSPMATQVATRTFSAVASQSHKTLVTHDVAPTGLHDSTGTSLMFMALGTILCGFITATVMGLAAPTMSIKGHLASILGMAFVGAAITTFVTYGIYGAYASHLPQVVALLTLAGAAAGIFHYSGSRLVGPAMTIITTTLMIILGIPASGAAVPVDMLPGFFAFLHPLLPTSVLIDGLRRILYFGSAGIAGPVSTLVAWVIASLWILQVSRLKSPKPEPATSTTTSTIAA